MSRYPLVLLFRHTNYSHIDEFIKMNTDKLMCTIQITSDTADLNKYAPNIVEGVSKLKEWSSSL